MAKPALIKAFLVPRASVVSLQQMRVYPAPAVPDSEPSHWHRHSIVMHASIDKTARRSAVCQHGHGMTDLRGHSVKGIGDGSKS